MPIWVCAIREWKANDTEFFTLKGRTIWLFFSFLLQLSEAARGVREQRKQTDRNHPKIPDSVAKTKITTKNVFTLNYNNVVVQLLSSLIIVRGSLINTVVELEIGYGSGVKTG